MAKRPTLEELREVFRPVAEAAYAHRRTQPGVSDSVCVCCGLIWYNELGSNGKVYCGICLGRGHDEDEA